MNLIQKSQIKYYEKLNRFNDEHKLIGGLKYPDKTFYVIRRSGYSLGLFSFFITALGGIQYAVDNGMIPVIDMCNFNNAYLDPSEIGKINSWELYFEQPTSFSLKAAYSGKNIILSNGKPMYEYPRDSVDFLNGNDGELEKWIDVYKRYISFKPDILKYMEKGHDDLFDISDRICGVLARGTDYKTMKPCGHPIQPDTGDIIKKTEEMMDKNNCDRLFLATEDEGIYREFKDYFGEKCVINEKRFVNYKTGFLASVPINGREERYIQGLQYLTTIYILSRCNCVVAGRTSGTVGAAIMSKGWEDSFFFDLGTYK